MTGNVTENVLPRPTPSLLAEMLPPCCSIRWRAMARPNPRPPCRGLGTPVGRQDPVLAIVRLADDAHVALRVDQ